MAKSKIKLVIEEREWAARILFPLWFVQVCFGFKPWMPDWAFKTKVVKG